MNKFTTITRPAPIAPDEIHPAWCTCSDCTLDRRRNLRLDLRVIAAGVAAALLVVAASWLGLV